MDIPDPILCELAAYLTRHARDPCKAYPELVRLVADIVSCAVQRAELIFQEDAAVVFDRLLAEHRAAWCQKVKAQMLSIN